MTNIPIDTYSRSTKQECFPVGCVPSAVVAISGEGCLPGGVSD